MDWKKDAYFEKVVECSFAFGLLFGEIHRDGEIVDESAINIEDNGLAEAADENIAELLILVPRLHAFIQSEPKYCVALQNLRQFVKQRRDLLLA